MGGIQARRFVTMPIFLCQNLLLSYNNKVCITSNMFFSLISSFRSFPRRNATYIQPSTTKLPVSQLETRELFGSPEKPFVKLRLTLSENLIFEVIFQNECECFIGVSKHEKTDESTRPQAECFYCFRVFGNPDETRCTSF